MWTARADAMPAIIGVIRLAVSAAMMTVSLPVLADDSLRCGGALIQTGDSASAVGQACGEPDFVDPWVAGSGTPYGRPLSMEAWTYNRGPNRLLQILVFRDGELKRITSRGYGFHEPRSAGDCEPLDIVVGMSKYELKHRCGRPEQKSGYFVYSSRRRSGGRTIYLRRGVVPVFREERLYNFGGNRLLREVTLENAVVVEVDTTERGFDER